ncbi:hypothetical protein VNI00_009015 [Paramarasmius palmivorus]|uniref:Cutinase n=1 Tax=Paramarasmius palmivorus TaxID=297713 RepID=A0AAW0CTS2_9AGAR
MNRGLPFNSEMLGCLSGGQMVDSLTGYLEKLEEVTRTKHELEMDCKLYKPALSPRNCSIYSSSMLAFNFVASSLLIALGTLSPVFATPLAERQQPCADVMVFFARGTTEVPPIGAVVGPPFATALAAQLAVRGTSLSFRGVDYPAVIAGYLAGGDPLGSRRMAADITNAANACPNAKIVSSGYSQGGQLVHNSAALLSPEVAARVSAVVIFGDPKSRQRVPNIDTSKVKVFCNFGDNICDGGVLILPPHLTYGTDATDAARFVVSKV